MSVCSRLNSMTHNFIWAKDGVRRGLNLVNWNTLTLITPKMFGGSGIHDTGLTNLALFGKLVWSPLNEKYRLWVQQ